VSREDIDIDDDLDENENGNLYYIKQIQT